MSLRTLLLIIVSSIVLSACETRSASEVILGKRLQDPESFFIKASARSNEDIAPNTSPELGSSKQKRRPKDGTSKVYKGTGKFIKTSALVKRQKTASGEEGITLNLVNVNIAQAAKAILGDILKVNYTVDERVNGAVTVQTTQPIQEQALVDIFETVLLTTGFAISEQNGFYRVLPASEVTNQARSLNTNRIIRQRIGTRLEVVPLHYVSATEIAGILKSVAPSDAVVRIDDNRSLIILSGTSKELATYRETISVFDVDWMKGMSFALVPVKTSAPEDIVQELNTIFANDTDGPTKNMLRFVPNSRLSSVLIISPQSKYIKKAQDWIKRLDAAGQSTSQQLFVYNIQNRSAEELAKVLQDIFSDKSSNDNATSTERTTAGDVAPRLAARQMTRFGENNEDGSGNERQGPPQTTPNGRQVVTINRSSKQNKSGLIGPVKIVTDAANNALLIMAAPKDYKRILRVLERIDVMPNQVLLEATIAEVTLNDQLRFGLKWFFEKGKSSFTLSEFASGAVQSAFPGFSYFWAGNNVNVALDTLASITNVNVISSPSLMVLDNKKAVLQVGDQVPIATQSAVSVNDDAAPIVNSITMKDTGVILSVTPRVNDSGRVILEIEQEVSDVVETTTSDIDSPTIQQRKIATTVAVNDGHSLALGGLIRENNSTTSSQIPIAGDIPVLGNLFKQKDNAIRRTELLIIVTPRVVRDTQEARRVTDEFRKQLNLNVRPERTGPPDFKENVERVFR
ncbi:MAG: type II secretion system secretin GspD [Pseudomonadota bacterium]